MVSSENREDWRKELERHCGEVYVVGGDDREAEAEDRTEQKKGRTVYQKKEEWQRSRWILSSKQRLCYLTIRSVDRKTAW